MTSYAMVDEAGAVMRVERCDETPAGGSLTPVPLLASTTILPSKPYAKATLRVANGALYWSDDRTLADARAEKWAAMKVARSAGLNGTFSAGGLTYNCNREAIVMAAVEALLAKAAPEPAWTKTWTLADNTSATLTADQVLAAARACGDHIGALWATARTLRAQINAAATIAAVDAITWP